MTYIQVCHDHYYVQFVQDNHSKTVKSQLVYAKHVVSLQIQL